MKSAGTSRRLEKISWWPSAPPTYPPAPTAPRPGRPQRNGAPTRRCGERCLTMAHCVWDTMPPSPQYALRNGSFRPPAGLTPDKWFVRNAGMVDIDTDATVNLDDEAREPARQKAQAERATPMPRLISMMRRASRDARRRRSTTPRGRAEPAARPEARSRTRRIRQVRIRRITSKLRRMRYHVVLHSNSMLANLPII